MKYNYYKLYDELFKGTSNNPPSSYDKMYRYINGRWKITSWTVRQFFEFFEYFDVKKLTKEEAFLDIL